MLKNIQPRFVNETIHYSLFFERVSLQGAGYAYPCDENGNVLLTSMGVTMTASYKDTMKHSHQYHLPRIMRSIDTYVEPASGECICGRHVELTDALDNFCDCGRCYNLVGQEVIPSTDPAVEEF